MLSTTQMYVFITSAMLLAITPGPDILTVLARGIAQGRKAASVTALGLALGCINHTLILVLGVAALLKASPAAFSVIKYLGGAYLAYIGIQMIRHRGNVLTPSAGNAKSLHKIFIQSILANLLNPKVALFFLAFLPQFVQPGPMAESLQLLVLGTVFMVVSLIIFLLVAFFAGGLGNKLQNHPKVFSRLQGGVGIFLITLGLHLAIQKL